jgi:hypothetical protein
MCNVKLNVTVRWKDEGFLFWRVAPALPAGVCWTIGMDFIDDNLDFRVKWIYVRQSGDVLVISSDMFIDTNVTEEDLEEIKKSGWEIST